MNNDDLLTEQELDDLLEASSLLEAVPLTDELDIPCRFCDKSFANLPDRDRHETDSHTLRLGRRR